MGSVGCGVCGAVCGVWVGVCVVWVWVAVRGFCCGVWSSILCPTLLYCVWGVDCSADLITTTIAALEPWEVGQWCRVTGGVYPAYSAQVCETQDTIQGYCTYIHIYIHTHTGV